MNYRIGITKHEHSVEGWVFDLPGCFSVTADQLSLRELLPVAIAEHMAWLRGRGEPVNDDAFVIEVDVVEEIATRDRAAADGEFAFDDDLRPVRDDEIARAVRHMEYARRDLLALIEPLPDVVLDWRPPESAMAKIDRWNPDVHTIREIAIDIANSEGYYRNGLSDEPGAPEPDVEVWAQLAHQRELTVARLRALSPEERGKVFQPIRPWQDRPEEWTARKAIRRIINHERFHTKEIEQRLAWLLLGVPDFGARVAASTGVSAHA